MNVPSALHTSDPPRALTPACVPNITIRSGPAPLSYSRNLSPSGLSNSSCGDASSSKDLQFGTAPPSPSLYAWFLIRFFAFRATCRSELRVGNAERTSLLTPLIASDTIRSGFCDPREPMPIISLFTPSAPITECEGSHASECGPWFSKCAPISFEVVVTNPGHLKAAQDLAHFHRWPASPANALW